MYDFIKKLGGSRPSTPVQSPTTPAPVPLHSAKSKLKGWSSRASSPMISFPKGKIITPPATPRSETPRTPQFRHRELPDVGRTPVYNPTPRPGATPQQRRERRSSETDRGASDTEILKPRPLRVMRRPAILGGPRMPVDEQPPPSAPAPSAVPPLLPLQTQHRARVRSSPAPPPQPVHPPWPPMNAAPPPPNQFDRARSTEPTPATRGRHERDRSREHRRAASYTATNPSPRFGEINLHWSMLPRGYTKKAIWFDIRFKPAHILLCEHGQPSRALKVEERNKLSVSGSTTVMRLFVRGWDDPIVVSNPRGITCADVWNSIFEYFNTCIPRDRTVNQHQWAKQWEPYRPAFERRCRDADRKNLVEGYEFRQGMRRVDMLNDRIIFGGLIRVEPHRPVAPGECELELSLLYPPPNA